MLCYNRCVYLGEEKTLKKMERKIHHVGFGINSQIPKCNISEVKNCGKSLYVTILTKGHTCESKLIEFARKCNVSCEYLLEDWEKGIYINTDPTGEYFPVRSGSIHQPALNRSGMNTGIWNNLFRPSNRSLELPFTMNQKQLQR